MKRRSRTLLSAGSGSRPGDRSARGVCRRRRGGLRRFSTARRSTAGTATRNGGRSRTGDHGHHERERPAHLQRILHLAARNSTTSSALVPPDRRQLGCSTGVGKSREMGQVGDWRIPGRLRLERAVHRHPLRRTLPWNLSAGAEGGIGEDHKPKGRAARRRGRVAEADQHGRLERLRGGLQGYTITHVINATR